MVNKKQFIVLMGVLFVKAKTEIEQIASRIGDDTKRRFVDLFKALKQ